MKDPVATLDLVGIVVLGPRDAGVNRRDGGIRGGAARNSRYPKKV